MVVRQYENGDLDAMVAIWNEVVDAGDAFPQEEPLTRETGAEFFAAQTHTGVAADDDGTILGLYILHPNNVGRCGHIANASYAVRSDCRGRHLGEKLVLDCLAQALRTPRLHATRHDPKRLPNEGWHLRRHLPVFQRNVRLGALRVRSFYG